MKNHHEGPHPEYTFHLESPVDNTVASRHAVLGIGSGSSSNDVLDFAVVLATAEDAALHVVHCLGPEDQPVETDSPEFENRLRSEMIAQRTSTCAALASHRGMWTYDCEHGEPVAVIMSTAQKYNAFTIVIGAPRQGPISALSQLLHNSVALRLTRQSRYPVVIVPAGVKSTKWMDRST